MSTPSGNVTSLAEFNWKPQPAAQAIVSELVAMLLDRCPRAAELSRRMKTDTGTRFIDWIDHVEVPEVPGFIGRIVDAGFVPLPWDGEAECYGHPGGIFPEILIGHDTILRVAIKVESVADFRAVWQLGETIVEGEPLAPFRRVHAWSGDRAELHAIERHGYRGSLAHPTNPVRGILACRHLETFRSRTRGHASDEEGFEHVRGIVDRAISDLGTDLTCDLFFTAEREYWQRRNRAARVQKARQDTLGLGWANHDHHTYRSSRRHFTQLIALWEKLGFTCRERFYAGAEAGWGAQVMEHPVTGIVTFNDVDLSPDELVEDFAHEPLSERERLGTIGLWCGLHGEAVLQAGMHHLEAMFDWHSLEAQLAAEAGIKTMPPFTALPSLRQAFTEGERWPVTETRLQTLLATRAITPDQAEKFRNHGAIGSHLENLERNDGFKGFNQKGVSDIIAKTDPRHSHAD